MTVAEGISWEVKDERLVPTYKDDRGNPQVAVWAPQPGSQEAVMTCPVFEMLYEGNRGGGKTDVLIMTFAQHCGKGFGISWRGILFRQTYKQLEDVITKTKQWFPQVFPEATFNEQNKTWKWPGGEELLLRHMKDPNDYWNYHGHAYPWIGWEELTTWPTDECYTRMMSVCRSADPRVPRMYRSTTNPYGSGHNWVKMRFGLPLPPKTMVGPIIQVSDEDGKPLPERVVIHSDLRENRVLLHADPDYIQKLRASATNEAQLKAWIEGSWDIVAGGMFDDVWTPNVHVIKAFDIPHSWRLDRAFDWGSSRPFSVGWWAESDGTQAKLADGTVLNTVRGDVFRVAEWYGWRFGKPNEGLRLTAIEIAERVKEMEKDLFPGRRVRPGPADASIFDTATSTGVSVAQEMQKAGIRWTKADKGPGSRVNGWQRTRTMLKNAIPTESPRELPGLFVFSNCDQFLRTIPALPRDEKNPDDVDTDAEDHIGDEMRYRLYNNKGRMIRTPVTGR